MYGFIKLFSPLVGKLSMNKRRWAGLTAMGRQMRPARNQKGWLFLTLPSIKQDETNYFFPDNINSLVESAKYFANKANQIWFFTFFFNFYF